MPHTRRTEHDEHHDRETLTVLQPLVAKGNRKLTGEKREGARLDALARRRIRRRAGIVE